jgi:hypothetical protein
MKKKQMIIGLALALVLAGAASLYRIVQHARQDLVTLNVTNAPLADVLARVARQTREQIVADQGLGGTITLNVRRAPLRQVLARIADQVGAFPRLNFAVGGSAATLTRLKDALRHGQDPAQTGWTNPAARLENRSEAPSVTRLIRHDGEETNADGPPDLAGQPGGQVDVRVTRGGPAGSGLRRFEVRSGGVDGSGATRATLMTAGPDGVVREIDLSPERLLLESELAARLASTGPTTASAETAARLAQRAGGKWSSIYSLESVPLPPGGLPPGLNGFSRTPGKGSAAPELSEAAVNRRRFDQLTRRTPEQRAREAAARPAPGTGPDIDVEAK